MVFKTLTFLVDDNYLNTRPGSPPAWPPSPPASPQASICCFSIISRFDGLRLQNRSRDGGAVGQMQEENPLGSNDSAGKVYGKKLVLLVALHEDGEKTKAMRLVSGFGGIASLSMDLKDNKLTVSGEFDPVKVVSKLRKSWHTEILSVGTGKEDEGKKDEGKKDEGKKNEDLAKALQTYYSTPITYYYAPHEEPPSCVIC